MITTGLTIENQNLINEKAKLKNDGCFKFRGVMYRVLNKKAVLFAYGGEIIQPFGAFNTVRGKYEYRTQDSDKKKLLMKMGI